jgi:hypothetical protein
MFTKTTAAGIQDGETRAEQMSLCGMSSKVDLNAAIYALTTHSSFTEIGFAEPTQVRTTILIGLCSSITSRGRMRV